MLAAGRSAQQFDDENNRKKLGALAFCHSFLKISHMRNAGKQQTEWGPGVRTWTYDNPISKNHTMEDWTSVTHHCHFSVGKEATGNQQVLRTAWEERRWRKLANITSAWSQRGPRHSRDGHGGREVLGTLGMCLLGADLKLAWGSFDNTIVVFITTKS